MSVKKELIQKEDGTIVEKITVKKQIDIKELFKKMVEEIYDVKKETERIIKDGQIIFNALKVKETPDHVFKAIYEASSQAEIDAIYKALEEGQGD